MRIDARIVAFFRTLLVSLLVLAGPAACGDDSPSEPRGTPPAEIAVVLNSGDISLTVFPVDSSAAASTIGLVPDGSPVSLAVRGATAVVPLGVVPAVAVVDLAAEAVARVVALPEGSGATGVAFLNDSIAVVANPGRNSVSPLDVRTGELGAEVPVGHYPQAIIGVNDTAYVLNAELGPDFQPAGPGTVTVLTGWPLEPVRTIELSGTNPGAAAIGPDGRIYVVNSGRFAANEGSLSVIDRATLAEAAHHTGFGDFPGSIAIDAGGRAYIGGFGTGLLVWDTESGVFLRGPADPVAPGGVASVSGVGVDAQGRVYTLRPDCQEPGRVYRLTAAYEVESEVPAGTCPIAIAFTAIETPS